MSAVDGLVAADLATTDARGDRLSCLLLGEESLLVHCAELLATRGHRITAIVTRSPSVARWAAGHAIPVLARDDYPALCEREPVDVILSITYPALIPAAVLGRARVAAINYHDGPLPRYAGINGSTWALHDGEVRHAVVWHHMTAGLDDGDILERRDVTLDARETSVSLNMKNAALALDGFRAVIDRLERRQLDGTPQSRAVERTVFSRHDRPAALCVIDWTATADAIDRLIRACDFGHYPNRFGLAKVAHHDRAVVVRESLVEAAVGAPGTVLAVAADGLLIACGQAALRLRGFAQPTGQLLAPEQAAALLGIRAGDRLTFEGRADAVAWTRTLAESEPAMVAALAERHVPRLPFERGAGGSSDDSRSGTTVHPLALPPALVAHFGDALDDAVRTAFCVALSAVVRDDRLDLALASHRPPPPTLAALCTSLVPWRVELDARRSFDEVRVELARQRLERAQRPGFLLDLVARHPTLREQPDLQRGELSTVALLGERQPLPPGTALALRSGADGHTLLADGRVAPADLEAFAGWMANLLIAAAADGKRPLAELDLLDDAQRSRQLFAWNATARPFPDTLRIHDLFDARVREQPDAVALVCDGRSMTFAEVEAGANRIAHALQARGVGPGQYVGLLVERGFALVLAMLGIAKSGAAYVPLDPGYPIDRCRFMLEDAGCAALVTSRALADRCPGLPLLLLDGDEIARAPHHRPPSSATADDVCYAIFTSGSTGKPKGVVLSHRAVVNTLDWVNRTFAITAADRLLFVTSPSFDLSVYDVFGALGAGASVEIATAATLRDPQRLARRLASGDITLWDSAPPALARLTPFLPPPAPRPGLRLVMLSGDWIPVALPDQLRRAFPGLRVASLGGATEAAIWSNSYEVRAVDPAWSSIPYGHPIQNCRYYVLDQHLRPLPAGITGGLYIGGICLAQGYLQRPELTAERFVPDPFLPGQRIYDTGDLARYWPDGTLEFRGRADAQVKVRGYRVELGEVESALAALPTVRQAVCIARPDASGQKSLLAYVVADAGFDVRAAKERLAATLPEYMVPSFIVPLAALPLNANGKLDRKALPAPESVRDRRPLRPARTLTEQRLLALWQDLLGRREVGIDDDFFELGGHSLLVVTLMERIRRQLDVDVPLSRLLDCPTIALLAASIDDAQREATADTPTIDGALTELRPGGPRHFFFIHDGDGETLLYRGLAQRLPSDFGVYGIAPRRLPRVRLAHRRIEDMATYCIGQMQRRQPRGPYYLGGLCAGGVIAFEMAAQLERAGETVEAVVLLEGFHPRAETRDSLIALGRLARLRDAFRAPSGGPPTAPVPLLRGLGRVAAKLAHFSRYELELSATELGVAARLQLLHRVLELGWEWPPWVPELAVRDIYMWAARRYRPPVLHARRVILVKSTAGAPGVTGDEPGRELYADPLFGWGPYVASTLEVVDVPGGHSTMLQEPNVAELARLLAPWLRPTTA